MRSSSAGGTGSPGGTDLAEMDQVSYFTLRRREKEKWVKIPVCASLTWQRLKLEEG